MEPVHPNTASRQRWYVVDRSGRAVSIGYQHRADAVRELTAITDELQRELTRLGRSRQRIDSQLAGFNVAARSRAGYDRSPLMV